MFLAKQCQVTTCPNFGQPPACVNTRKPASCAVTTCLAKHAKTCLVANLRFPSSSGCSLYLSQRQGHSPAFWVHERNGGACFCVPLHRGTNVPEGPGSLPLLWPFSHLVSVEAISCIFLISACCETSGSVRNFERETFQ
jgi:hypothetical protein